MNSGFVVFAQRNVIRYALFSVITNNIMWLRERNDYDCMVFASKHYVLYVSTSCCRQCLLRDSNLCYVNRGLLVIALDQTLRIVSECKAKRKRAMKLSTFWIGVSIVLLMHGHPITAVASLMLWMFHHRLELRG